MSLPAVVVIESSPAVRAELVRQLKSLPCRLFDAENLFSGLRLACAVNPALVIIGGCGDGRLLEGFVRELQRLPSLPATKLHPSTGSSVAALLQVSAECLARRETGPRPATAIVGRSAPMSGVREYICKVAATDCPVLIMGETGTGKELVARRIHESSPRWNKPFVALNCASIPDALFESELFGHERGAFTGAFSRRPGRFVEATGGTLFLDEIGELSLYSQAKLLRVLETHRVEPLGGLAGVDIDVRFLSATNRSLEDLLKQGTFRGDLFYRLAVTKIQLPTLRQRVEDIPELLDVFREDVNRRSCRAIDAFAAEVLDLLFQHAWPGNIRELRNLVDAIAVEKHSGTVCLADLPAWFVPANDGTQAPLDDRASLVAALERTQWNKSRAARHLGWSRMKLYRQLQRHGLHSFPPSDPPVLRRSAKSATEWHSVSQRAVS